MKFQGKYRAGCQCRYCIGDGDSAATLKALKHGDRQKVKKEIRNEIRDANRRRKKEVL